jgi:chorismate-pyruvate lyase
MIEKRTVKVIKRQEPKVRERSDGAAESDGGSNIWSRSVRLWVDQYRQASAERLPAFDRLFKDSPAGRVPLND